MSNTAIVHREISIDCGHRVPDHTSKCRSPHGHRYRIIATCCGEILEKDGHSEDGMVIDFGRIKQFMMDVLDGIYDHAFIVSQRDTVLMNMYFPGQVPADVITRYDSELDNQLENYCLALEHGHELKAVSLPMTLISAQDPAGMKIVPVGYTPTVENMAKHMFDLLDRVMRRSFRGDEISLTNIRLYETPNCSVDYPGTQITGPS